MNSEKKLLLISNIISLGSIGLLSYFAYSNSFSGLVVALLVLVPIIFIFLSLNSNEVDSKLNEEKIEEEIKTFNLDSFKEASQNLANSSLNVKFDTNSENDDLNKVAQNLNIFVENNKNTFDDISNYFDAFQKNDFSKAINISQSNDLKNILEIINNVNVKISRMLLSSLKSGMRFKANADSLRENLELLTQNISTQATKLEDTSSSMEEITSSVRANNQDVDTMLNYTKELTSSVQNGYNSAKNSASFMDRINEKTKSIEEAITIIDQIAFQTNILSLNAAVEAATAGEAGKGFAVVAQEVRNLASRSAEAAREIKSLVESATFEANNGKNASAEMIKEYDVLNENITKTKTLIENISNSLREQEKGIQQINISISEIDRATQQNAQNAERTKEIANQNDEMATKMVVDTNKTNFFGKDEFNAKNS